LKKKLNRSLVKSYKDYVNGLKEQIKIYEPYVQSLENLIEAYKKIIDIKEEHIENNKLDDKLFLLVFDDWRNGFHHHKVFYGQ
jgi:hypothetical protein